MWHFGTSIGLGIVFTVSLTCVYIYGLQLRDSTFEQSPFTIQPAVRCTFWIVQDVDIIILPIRKNGAIFYIPAERHRENEISNAN